MTTSPPRSLLRSVLRPVSGLVCGVCCALLSVATALHAERADRNKPMNIEADTLRHDELQQTTTFTGRVVMTKGTIVLRGASLQLRQDADGHQHGRVTADSGKRAFFRQKRDTVTGQPEEFVEGEGESIEYDGRSDTVKLIRHAELRRYRDSQLSDEINGALIVYSNQTERFSVEGSAGSASGAAGAASGEGRSGRVRAVLAPKTTASAAAPAQEPPPRLRPSPRLTTVGTEGEDAARE